MKRIKCKSGVIGEQYKLQSAYINFQEFESYCKIYNNHGRLGFDSVKECWDSNPTIQSSVIPSDLKIVK